MRLNPDLASAATVELLRLLRNKPNGLTTQELVGGLISTSLTGAQVIRLLRASGLVTERQPFGGRYALPITWMLKEWSRSKECRCDAIRAKQAGGK